MKKLAIEERCHLIQIRMYHLLTYRDECKESLKYFNTLQMEVEIEKINDKIKQYRNELKELKQQLKA